MADRTRINLNSIRCLSVGDSGVSSAHQLRGTEADMHPTCRPLADSVGHSIKIGFEKKKADTYPSVCVNCEPGATMARDDDDKQSLHPLILDDSLSVSSSSPLGSPRLIPVRFASSRRRRIVVVAVTFFSAISLLVLAYLSSSRPFIVSQDPVLSLNHTPSSDRKSALLGPPTRHFRGSPPGSSTTFPPS